ncbi:Mrp/NBP35 family ATP-binding protein [Alkalicoccus urumqiensis]|uniref:Iron-sulfur cluster carrier protein n=1 Tax=Alkalicoccus urumqiensis TaxID=1548213 RepID=A0A2P6MLL1_ALKUR|nr:Mrp/NBP35 family ATP-binding protein [Alkalicoccus urumqiensis]PRO67164.1 chromosome partitioning protein ParA [Alkalicoccus urumqiensis]
MITEEKVREVLAEINDPHLHTSLTELGAVKEIKIKEKLLSLKLAIAQPGTAEQMQLQQEVVTALKEAGADSVGLRFEQLPDSVVSEYGTPEAEEEKTLLDRADQTTFISITSGKGGVGKSTVSVNLAISLAREGKKVGIIDADIYGFSVPDMMGIEERPRVENEKIYPVERFGVQVISMGFFVEDNSPIIWRGPMLGKMLNNFFNEVVWDDLDYLILDLPPGTGDVALDIHSMLPQTKEIIVTTPHATAAFVAARAGAMAMKTEHEILGIIENMAYFESQVTGEKEYVFGKGGGQKLAEELRSDVLAQIPLGQPEEREDIFAPSVYDNDHPIGRIYSDIAKDVITRTAKE